MADLHRALNDISSIRRQMAQTTEFRGYGPATLAATACLAILAASAQSRWLVEPADHLRSYLALWIATAILSATLSAVQMYTRSRRMHSGLSDEMIRMAAEQFLPAVAAGLLITLTITCFAPGVFWILPGLWQVIFSLGVFSSCRFLPRPMLAAGVWYLLSGLYAVSLGDSRSLTPWIMGIAFGFGQLLVAAILFVSNPGDTDEV